MDLRENQQILLNGKKYLSENGSQNSFMIIDKKKEFKNDIRISISLDSLAIKLFNEKSLQNFEKMRFTASNIYIRRR